VNPEEYKGRCFSGFPEEHKPLMFLSSLKNVSSVMFLGSLRNIISYVPQCHVAEEHNLCSLAPTSMQTYVCQDMFLSYVPRP
jgi:hypothetical protein